MRKFKALTLVACTALPLLGASPMRAQPAPPAEQRLSGPPRRYAPRRIEIYPGRLLYRRCVDWYELQNRPSGTVLFPQMHCWWVRG
jgi:hypothetical protein